jgi:hypothetical protein
MAWRDRLRDALARAAGPQRPNYADADCADCANPSPAPWTDQQIAQLAQLATARFQQIAPRQRTPALTPATADQAAEERADREAIAAEPLLPPPGRPERDRMDRRHAEVLDGYLRAALQRPPA